MTPKEMLKTIMLQYLYLPLLAVAVGIVYGVSRAIYNVFFHPLRKYPGPVLNRMTAMTLGCYKMRGTYCHHLKELHEKYGDVVRAAPNELSFLDEQAWPDIYGHATPSGERNLQKDHRLMRLDVNGSTNILAAKEADHRRFRRIQTNMFSTKTLLTQEPLIKSYVDKLISRLHEKAADPSTEVVDIVSWYNYTTFDILGDLAFGESFGCLKSDVLHTWIEKTYLLVKDVGYYTASKSFPWPLSEIVYRMTPRKTQTARFESSDFAGQKARERMSRSTDRADFMSYILKHNDEKGMTNREIENNARILILAGSETTATFLSGFTYNLLLNPQHLSKLTSLIRTSFVSEEEITTTSLIEIEYLNALINESFRFYPSIPMGLVRVAHPGGSVICGHVIPEMTSVYVSPLAANSSEKNWTDPVKFVPERWYKDENCPERYRADKRNAMKPFSYGPRNCIGRNLAEAEMRLIIARLLWNFDLELKSDSSGEWFDQKIYVMWEKRPLYVRLIPRKV